MGFAEATAVAATGDGRHSAEVRPGWDIGGNANGGYLLAIAARAMSGAAGRPDPATRHRPLPGARPARPRGDQDRAGQGGQAVHDGAGHAFRRRRPVAPRRCSARSASCPTPVPSRRSGSTPSRPTSRRPTTASALRPGRRTFPRPFMQQGRLSAPPRRRRLRQRPTERRAARCGAGSASATTSRSTPSALLHATDAFPPTIFNADLPVAWTRRSS